MVKNLLIILVVVAIGLSLVVVGCQYDAWTSLGIATGAVRCITVED